MFSLKAQTQSRCRQVVNVNGFCTIFMVSLCCEINPTIMIACYQAWQLQLQPRWH
uniref:Uncharacterized protein n=1 Tax=Helianthus annuus TaxID=4232 RepID=A0A251SNN3_HELAN